MKSIISKLIAFSISASFASAHCGACEAGDKEKHSEEKDHAHAVVGEKAPAFTLKNAEGKEVSLEDYAGKIVVLEWVNFDCPFVKKHYDNGDMQKLQKAYTEQDVAWLLIHSAHKDHPTFKTGDELKEVAEKQGLGASEVLIDMDGQVGKAYEAKTTPHMFVINKDGVLAYAGAIDSIKSANAADVAKADNYVVLALESIKAGEVVKTPETKAYGCSVKYEN